MDKRSFGKGLAIGMVLLFIGAGVIPSINGSIEKINDENNLVTFSEINEVNLKGERSFQKSGSHESYFIIQDIETAWIGEVDFYIQPSGKLIMDARLQDVEVNWPSYGREVTGYVGINVSYWKEEPFPHKIFENSLLWFRPFLFYEMSKINRIKLYPIPEIKIVVPMKYSKESCIFQVDVSTHYLPDNAGEFDLIGAVAAKCTHGLTIRLCPQSEEFNIHVNIIG